MVDDKYSLYGKWTIEEVTKFIDDWYDIFDESISVKERAVRQSHIDGALNQVDGFVESAIGGLPDDIKEDISSGMSILDWGCSVGGGTESLRVEFPDCEVTGLDISEVSLNVGREKFPKCKFVPVLDRHYDVIYSSNCMEHFIDPLTELKKQLKFTDKYYIVLVPLNGRIVDKIGNHMSTISETTFPNEIDGFKRVFEAKIRYTRPAIWNGEQLYLIYKKVDNSEAK